MARFPWSALGLTPSATAQDVRRAYAQRLRAIDPDSDPQGFAKLRQARDRALGTIRARNMAEEDNSDRTKDGLIDAHASLSIKGDATLRPDSHSADAAPRIDTDDGDSGSVNVTTSGDTLGQDMATHQETLMAILLDGDPETPLTGDEQARVSTALDRMFTNPMMHAIDTAADMENWLAHVFAQSTPRSHPFAQRLADQFNWRQEAGTINQSGAVRWLTERALAFDFRDRVTQPSNKGYGAWIELTTPADDYSKRGRAKMVPELLSAIRRDHPVLEHELDWFRVSLWDRSGSPGASGNSGLNWGRIAIGALVAVQILGALGRCSSDIHQTDQQQIEQVQLAEFDDPVRRRVTMDDALRAMGGEDLTIEKVEIRRPSIIDAFNRKLDDLKLERRSLENVEADLTTLLHQRLLGGLADAPYAHVRAYREAQVAGFHQLRTTPDLCHAFLVGAPLSSGLAMIDVIEPLQSSVARIILETEKMTDDSRGHQFTGQRSIFDAAANRAHMTREELLGTLSNSNASDEKKCRAAEAILSAGLAAPRADAEQLLRSF